MTDNVTDKDTPLVIKREKGQPYCVYVQLEDLTYEEVKDIYMILEIARMKYFDVYKKGSLQATANEEMFDRVSKSLDDEDKEE